MSRFPDHPRYRIVRRLGQGAIGIVYEAHDLEREQRVALKTLARSDAQALFSLKREFRSLADLQHPNVAMLYDLVVEGSDPFFTMELVQGVDIVEYCRAGVADDEDVWSVETVLPESMTLPSDTDKVRRVMGQLVRGVRALHRAGVLHRDIKPSNLLVADDGTLKILDFGLAVHLEAMSDETSVGEILGTPAYMSPEQAFAEEDLTPASDWYSVGVILFQLLAGRLPFEGASLKLLMTKRETEAPAPRSIIPAVPEDLDRLCVELLAIDPTARPDGSRLLELLDAGAAVEEPAAMDAAAVEQVFAGRGDELRALDHALTRVRESGAHAVRVQGPSGIGKTALVREWLSRVEDGGVETLVLAGKCYERESVPYRAMDGVIDELSRHWRQLPDVKAAALLPREGARLRQLFPVLGRVGVIAAEPERNAQEDPDTRRNRGYAALRETFQRLALRQRLILVLDDVQWIDRDSVYLLAGLLRQPEAPPLLLVLLSREYSPEETPLLAELLRNLGGAVETIEVGPLPAADCEQLATLMAGSIDREQLRRIAEESDGNPFLLGELARYVRSFGGAPVTSLRFQDVVARRRSVLSDEALRLLEVVCVSGDPVPLAVAQRAAGLESGEAADAARMLAGGQLIQSAGGDRYDQFEPYHNRILETVVGGLDAAARQAIHRRLAVAYDSSGRGTDDQLMRHWQGAGEGLRAARHARAAGDKAAASMDFDGAADRYRTALELGDWDVRERAELWRRLGEAAGFAGRPLEAALAYEQAAEGASRTEVLEMRRRAMEQLLGGGYVAEGLEAASELLAAVGLSLPKSPASTLLRIALNELRLRAGGLRWKPRKAADVSADPLTQAQVALTLGTTLSIADTLRANAVMGRALLLALKVGEPGLVTHAAGVASCFASARGNPKLARRFQKVAEEAAAMDASPRSAGFVSLVRQFYSFFIENRWGPAIEAAEETLEHFTSTGRGRFWERDASIQYLMFARLYRGELRRMTSEASELLQASARGGNRLLNVGLRTGLRLRHLIADDPDAALADLREALSDWIPEEQAFQVQHWYALGGRCEVALYADTPQAAQADLDARAKAMKRSLLLHVERLRCEYLHVVGRTALALAVTADATAERKRHADIARGHTRTLSRSDLPMGRFFAHLLEAGAARVEDDRDAAARSLREAIPLLEETETLLYATAARRQLGTTVGGEEGERLVREADAWMTERGVVRPDRLTATLVPGWPHPG